MRDKLVKALHLQRKTQPIPQTVLKSSKRPSSNHRTCDKRQRLSSSNRPYGREIPSSGPIIAPSASHKHSASQSTLKPATVSTAQALSYPGSLRLTIQQKALCQQRRFFENPSISVSRTTSSNDPSEMKSEKSNAGVYP